MKKYLSTLLALALCATAAQAQVVLSLDFNDRSNDTQGNLETNFTSFVIGSVVSSTAIQTNATTRNFGAITVSLSGNGTNPGYDDRLRTVPSNSVAFTQERLLKDVIFSADTTTNGGMNINVTGLIGNEFYHITIWSFDNGSTGARVSDWFVNGLQLVDNYTFNGSNLPTNNSQYQFTMSARATGTGQLLIQGRRDPTTSSAGGVFLNALQLELAPPDPPVITGNPASVDLYQGDNTSFSVKSGGTPPFTFQWFQNETNLLTDATNATLFINNAQLTDAGSYSAIVSNISGSATSAPATLIVRTITKIGSGLLAYWPLDTISDYTPDLSGHLYHLFATNMDSGNLTTGQIGNALTFNGTDEFLTRTNAPGEALPAYSYPAYSVTLWVKGNFAGQNDRRVFAESWNANNNTLMTIGTDSATNGPVVDIFIRNNNGSNPLNHKKSSLAAFDDNWHHIAWVDNNGSAQLYVDGVRDTNDFNYTRGVLTPNIETVGGVYRTNAQALFAGKIDDVAVWRRSLNSNEVQFVMANGAGELAAPVVTLQPVKQTVPCSDTATFTVGASGAPTLSYQWHDKCGDIPDATNATFVISNATLADAGNYFVTISNEFGVVSSDDATLALNTSISPTLPLMHITRGANAEISWPAAFGTFALQETPTLNLPISWTTSSATATTNGTNLSVSVPFGAGNMFYRLIGPPLCPPQPLPIVGIPTGRAANLGNVVTLTASAVGTPPITYQWRLNGQTLDTKTNATLTIDMTGNTNFGAYEFIAQDTNFAHLSLPAVVRPAGPETALADNLADSAMFTDGSGFIHGTTFGATAELDEPQHAGQPGGKSVWLIWNAPADGIATFDTIGSAFDTLLAVYEGTGFFPLSPVASDDDGAPPHWSKVSFNAMGGHDYLVALDGVAGASGFYNLRWNLEVGGATVPIITEQPRDAIVSSNGTATFSVAAGSTGIPATYRWFKNGLILSNATSSDLTISNVNASAVAEYFVSVNNGQRSIDSRHVLLQMTSNTNEFFFDPKILFDFVCGVDTNSSPFAGPHGKGDKPHSLAPSSAGSLTSSLGSYSPAGGCPPGICTARPIMKKVNISSTCTTSCTVTLSLAGTVGSTTIAVYRPLTSSPVTGTCATGSGTTQPTVTFTAHATDIYYVIVGSTSTTSSVTLNYTMSACAP